MILGGHVAVDGAITTKPAALVTAGSVVALIAPRMPYVSRGGLKLRHAIDTFDIPFSRNLIALDVGASTGGFTDVLLETGVVRVYAVDVGYGQLAWKLRNDPRVVVMERTNIRNLRSLPEPISLTVIDTSFISLRTVLPAVTHLMTEESDIVALVKPQFEAGRGQVGRKGVVRDPVVWRTVLTEVLATAGALGWSVAGLEPSPIRGPAGNVEFLAHLARGRALSPLDTASEIDKSIERATRLR
jgi:23S rRNA (cytidine1920-2'-O)/16S rRNA (cytidine1409-2'-O)-methyltransferase